MNNWVAAIGSIYDTRSGEQVRIRGVAILPSDDSVCGELLGTTTDPPPVVHFDQDGDYRPQDRSRAGVEPLDLMHLRKATHV